MTQKNFQRKNDTVTANLIWNDFLSKRQTARGFISSLVTPTLRASICAGYSEERQNTALYPARLLARRAGMTNAASRGFTLIELLVVVLIIGILAAVALPQYQKAIEKTRVMNALSMLKSMAQAQEVYYVANGRYTTNPEDLDIDLPAGTTKTTVTGNSEVYLTPDKYKFYFGDSPTINAATDKIQLHYYLQHSDKSGITCFAPTNDPVATAVCKSLGVFEENTNCGLIKEGIVACASYKMQL